MALEKELETFKTYKPELLRMHRGEWALIYGEAVDTWHCYQDALKVGYQKYGLNPFLVKQILSEDQTRMFLGLAGRVNPDGKTEWTSVGLLDKPVDPRCFIDVSDDILGIILDDNGGVKGFNSVPDHTKTASL